MAFPQTSYVAPDHQTVKRKRDILNYNDLAGIQCELDFISKESTLPPNALGSIMITLGFVSLVSTALIAAFSVYAFRPLLQPFVALTWMLFLAVPTIYWFAGRLTTFGVHWITAHPRGDGLAMIQCREIWATYRSGRSVSSVNVNSKQEKPRTYNDCTISPPVALQDSEQNCRNWMAMLKTVRRYHAGIFWILATIGQSVLLAWLACDETKHPLFGTMIVLATLLTCLGITQLRDSAKAIPVVAKTLLHWFYYDINAKATPWMLQSPCGKAASRFFQAAFTVGVLAVGVNVMAGGYVGMLFPLSRMLVDSAPMQLILTLAGAALLAAIVPLILMFLMLCVIAGPTLQAFHQLYHEH